MEIRYVEKCGDEMSVYEVDDHGNPAFCAGTARRMEPRNLEQWLGRFWDNLQEVIAPYHCACGGQFMSWPGVMSHCDLYPCRDCQRATPKWNGWNYRCPPCDVAANPDYHGRNPGYYQS